MTWRHTAPGRQALSGQGSYRNGGRWNPADTVATLYLAQPKQACLAELQRLIATQPVVQFPRDIHEIEVSNLDVLDLTSTEALANVALTADDISGDDRSACAAVGHAAHFAGFHGVVAPSATRTGIVIAVFEPLPPGHLTLLGTTSLPSTPP